MRNWGYVAFMVLLAGIVSPVLAHEFMPPVEEIAIEAALLGMLRPLSLALTVGGALWWALIWADGRRPLLESRLQVLSWVGWLGIGAALLHILTQFTLRAAGIPLLYLLQDEVTGELLLTTSFGHLWLIQAGLWLMIGAALSVARQRPDTGYRAVIVFAVLFTAVGAVPTESPFVWLVWSVQTLSALALAGWLGVMAAFLLAFWTHPLKARARLARAVPVMLGCAVVWVLGALYAGLQAIGSIQGLIATSYGQAFIAQLLLFAAAFRLLNARRLYGVTAAARSVWVWAGGLTALLVGMVAMIGALGAVDTALVIMDWRIESAIDAPDTHIFEPVIYADYRLDLTILPGIVGENEVYITLFEANTGERLNDAAQVNVALSHAESGAQHTVMLGSVGDGNYRGDVWLDASGAWAADLRFDHAEIAHQTALTVTVAAPLVIPDELVTLTPSMVFGLLLIGAVMLAIFLLDGRGRRTQQA